MTESFIKLSSYSTKELRSIKQDIEKLILDKIKKLEKPESKQNEQCVYYMKEFSLDKIGNPIQVGETGIAEGWNIPM